MTADEGNMRAPPIVIRGKAQSNRILMNGVGGKCQRVTKAIQY